jgi:hypothetical protein
MNIIGDRFIVGTTTVEGRPFAMVVDQGRHEQFCLVDPEDCWGGMQVANVRALQIAQAMNALAATENDVRPGAPMFEPAAADLAASTAEKPAP